MTTSPGRLRHFLVVCGWALLAGACQATPKPATSLPPPNTPPFVVEDRLRAALGNVRVIRVTVQQSAGSGDVRRPFEELASAILSRVGFKVVGSESREFDATVAMRVEEAVLGGSEAKPGAAPPRYAPPAGYHYPGAKLVIRFTFEVPGGAVFSGHSVREAPADPATPGSAPLAFAVHQGGQDAVRSVADLSFPGRLAHMIAALYGPARVTPLLKRASCQPARDDYGGLDLALCQGAASALTAEGNPYGYAVLIETVLDDDFNREIVIRALHDSGRRFDIDGATRRGRVIAVLVETLVSNQDCCSGMAAELLARIGEPSVAALVRVVDAPDHPREVRRWAADALASIGGAEALGAVARYKAERR